MIDSKKRFDKVLELSNFKRDIESLLKSEKIDYHGLKDLNPEGYPYFVQWNHKYPVLQTDDIANSYLIKIPKEIAFGIELMLCNTNSLDDFQKQIDKMFKKKSNKLTRQGLE